MVTIGGGELGKFDDESECLVTISLKVMDFKDVSLSRLIEIRQKENSATGVYLRELRRNYLKKIEEYADQIRQVKRVQDIEEIKRVFEQNMRTDFDLLRDELKDEAQKVIFSNEMAAAVVGLVGSVLQPAIAPIGIGTGAALYRKRVEYRAARNKTLRGHPMSWLYSMKKIQMI
ncbi:hypothetical protein J5X98_13495 [Leptothermofonsia sichuanensis E412]|uniref:hypothetical protein n=1 Tax=Leptothermofonsia sichuanensis TaxID=2917832 RepID=UPI001CA7AAA1|nr:hypothetical protein [Leptothermofonsia sichuanensis]QZZ23256.1 hypothetical protein J5X98_13495 [Leptothermofonsia sichuanensis E412]